MAIHLESTDVVGIVGAGAMGAGIAQIAAAAGHTVKLYDTRPESSERALASIRKTYQMLADKGRMTAEAATAAGARLQSASRLSELAGAKLIVEAIVENLEIKQQLFASLEDIVNANCILATNTSSISITALGAKLTGPGRLVGMHFFNPVPLMGLVEVISGLATDPHVAEIIYATAAAWGKKPVYAKSTPGFIVNRVARPFYGEGLRIFNEQASDPATIDAIMREAGGFRMGPFELMDMIGHDVNFAVTQSVFQAYFNDPRFTPSLVQQELLNAGYLGKKSGRGFYSYAKDAVQPTPQTETPVGNSASIHLRAAGNIAEALSVRFISGGVNVSHVFPTDDGILFECEGTIVCLTDGRQATQRARDIGVDTLVLVDLAFDYRLATRIALAPADQCSQQAYNTIVGIFQQAHYNVSRLNDVPGMAVMRTVAMLANEAADAVNQGVCTAAAADIAMVSGVNYPRGPLAWADAIGLPTVVTVMDHLARVYGEDRYRASPLLRRKVASGIAFHGA